MLQRIHLRDQRFYALDVTRDLLEKLISKSRIKDPCPLLKSILINLYDGFFVHARTHHIYLLTFLCNALCLVCIYVYIYVHVHTHTQ